MAREKDITRRPKFFARKKGVIDEQLCERCSHHKFVILIRHGCDAIMFTNTKLRNGYEVAGEAQAGRFIHMWCINEDEAPDCLEHFREVKAVR